MNAATSLLRKFKPVIVQPTSKHTATVIFLHGSGSNGPDLRVWVKMCCRGKDLVEPHIKFIYPTAPARPYTAAGGMMSNVWFDRKEITLTAPEDNDSMEAMCADLGKVIDGEVENGIPRNRIVLGGFSMGGALSLYYGLQYGKGLAGIFCLSSFLSDSSNVFKTLESTDTSELPLIFQAHGNSDGLVLYEWGKRTNQRLSGLGVNVGFHEYPLLDHELSPKELDDLKHWLSQQLPEKSS